MSLLINLLKNLKKPFLLGQLPQPDQVCLGGLLNRDGAGLDNASPQRRLLAHKALC